MGYSINPVKILLVIVILASSLWMLSLNFGELDFNKTGMLVGQWDIHFGFLETYPHIYAAVYHFLTSLVAAYVIYTYFRGARFGWKPTLAGIIFSGLIGLGEALEHFFVSFWFNFFHYIHMISAPLVIYFLYLGAWEYLNQAKMSIAISTKKIIVIFGAFFLLSAILASQATTAWDRRIEEPFIYIVAPPMVLFTFLLLKEAKKGYEEHGLIMISIPALAISTTFLGLDILLGRYAHIVQNGWLYVVSHGLQDLLHAVTGTVILLFAASALTLSKILKKDLLVDWYKDMGESK